MDQHLQPSEQQRSPRPGRRHHSVPHLRLAAHVVDVEDGMNAPFWRLTRSFEETSSVSAKQIPIIELTTRMVSENLMLKL